MSNKNIELLAPAGNYESFILACKAGADAVYMGLSRFNARVMAENFNEEKYIECIKYAHLRGVKVYLTLNTLLYDDEIEDAISLVLNLYKNGLDAVILQDIGFAKLVHELIPKLSIHASTQMSVYSLSQVLFLQKLGFSRVVLARELSVNEIEYICKNSNVEIEVFIHGALCVSYSGQCMLSNIIGGRSANRGNCAQPCRMKYSLINKKTRNVDEDNNYLLSKKDICGIDKIGELVKAGVTSLKIEGRNKNKEYVAGSVSIYRKKLDEVLNLNTSISTEEEKLNLMQLFNRDGFSEGYLSGTEYIEGVTKLSPKNTGIYIGDVLDQKGDFVKIKLNEKIGIHDGIEIYSENVYSNIITCIKDNNRNIINTDVEKGNIVWLGDIKSKIKYGSRVYKTSSKTLNNKFLNIEDNFKNKVKVKVYIKANEKIYATVFDTKIEIDFIPELAKKKALNVLDVKKSFEIGDKNIPIEFDTQVYIDDNIFVPTSKINELRRNVLDKVITDLTKKSYDDIDEISIKNALSIENKKSNINHSIKSKLYVYKFDINKDYKQIYKEKYNNSLEIIYINIFDYIKYEDDINNKYNDIKISLYIPNVVLKNGDKIINENIEKIIKSNNIYAILIGSLSYFKIVYDLKIKYNKNIILIADYTLNVTNKYSAKFFSDIGFDVITMSCELDGEKIDEISKYANIEVVKDYITVMTSRHCIIGSFIGKRTKNTKCTSLCTKSDYVIKDKFNKEYILVCDNIDCIMRIIREFDLKYEGKCRNVMIK